MNELPFNEAFKIAWDEWLSYRKERKLPKYAATGLKKTLTHLVNISNNNEQTACAIIDQSIIQNYQGLFPLKTSYGIQFNQTGNPARAGHNLGTSEARIKALKEWGSTGTGKGA